MTHLDNRDNQHSISLLVNNKPGVLIRIALVFSRRGFNLESVVVSPTNDQRFSRMSLVVSGDPKSLAQIILQLNKLVDVLHARDHTGEDIIEKELALFKVRCRPSATTEILKAVDGYKCQTVDITHESMTLQATGSTADMDALTRVLDVFGVLESIRSGKLIMTRGAQES